MKFCLNLSILREKSLQIAHKFFNIVFFKNNHWFFTFYVKNGWLIENGKIKAPIKDVNIIGNGPEALKKVTMAANDSKLDTGGWTCGKNGQGVPVSQGMPTVLVSSMTVGGANG